MLPRRHTQRERYGLLLSLADLEVGDFEFFPLREGETPEVAVARIHDRVYDSKATKGFGWSFKALPDGVRVMKTRDRREADAFAPRLHHAGVEPDHGARARYLSGCRCILCRQAHAEHSRMGMARSRAKKRAQTRSLTAGSTGASPGA